MVVLNHLAMDSSQLPATFQDKRFGVTCIFSTKLEMIYGVWEASVLLGQLLALQEGSAVDWMTKESSINFRQGKSFLSSSKHPGNLMSPAQPPIQSMLRVKWLGQEANHVSLCSARIKNVWSCVCCTSTPLYSLTVWCLMKHGDSCTLYEVFSC